MAIVRKFTIGVAPFAKMFRMPGLAGAAIDAVLRLRSKSLADDYFKEVGANVERSAYRVSNAEQSNLLQLTEDSIVFTKDYYESESSFDFKKVLDEFRTIWAAVNSVLAVQDIRRIGIVAEYRFNVDSKSSSGWLREKFTTLNTNLHTEKFQLRFEEREFATDGLAPDPKKADFINYIYNFYDSALDTQHSADGYCDVDLDVQRYFAPVLNGNVGDEVLKLHKHFEAAQRRLDEQLKALGASHAKK
jgi:uncharacterized protein (TIGR04255 family)